METLTKVKFNASEVEAMHRKALEAAVAASTEWLRNASSQGPKYEVSSNGHFTGYMLDLCGNAYIKFTDRRDAFYKTCTALKLTYLSNQVSHCAGVWSPANSVDSMEIRYPLRSRQEHGLHLAACKAAVKVFNDAGVTCLRVHDYID